MNTPGAFQSRPAPGLRILLLLVTLAPLVAARVKAVTGITLGKICGIEFLTGLPCPFCFGIRSWTLMAKGQIAEAFLIHPLGAALFCAFVVAALWLAVAILFRLPELPLVRWTNHRLFWWAVFAVVLIQWAYSLVRMAG